MTGKDAYADRSIFLPAAGYGIVTDLNGVGSYGYYWSSTYFYTGGATPSASNAKNLYFVSDAFIRQDSIRYNGQSVRPVRGFAE